MTSKVLTDDEVTSFVKKAHAYIEMMPNYTDWAPIKRIPDGYKHTWYIQERTPVAEDSKDGRDYKVVQTSRKTDSANIVSYRNAFSIPRVTVEMARLADVDIWAENVAAVLKHLDMTIAHLCVEGSYSGGKVAINGLRDGGTDIGATVDADAWDTVTNPRKHLAHGWAALNTAGFTGRKYKWVMSSNLAPGLKAKYGAGDPTHESMVGEYDVDQVVYLPIGASTELQTYPISTASADDGVWFLYPKDEDVWYLAEVMPVTVKMNSELNVRTNSYEGFVEWRGTVAILQATGIQYTNSVNLA